MILVESEKKGKKEKQKNLIYAHTKHKTQKPEYGSQKAGSEDEVAGKHTR